MEHSLSNLCVAKIELPKKCFGTQKRLKTTEIDKFKCCKMTTQKQTKISRTLIFYKSQYCKDSAFQPRFLKRRFYKYCNKRVLSITHMLILNVCLTMCMHSLYTSTQHPNETLEPLNWIRVRPSCRDERSHEHSHVLYYVSCNISKYTTFKPQTRPSFRIFIPSNGSHLIKILTSYKMLNY